MKLNYVLFLMLFSLSWSQAQIVNIPDASLKLNLTTIDCVDIDNDGFADIDADTNDDGEIQVSEAEAVEHIILQGTILDLTGLDAFSNLKSLNAEVADFYEFQNVGGTNQYVGIETLDFTPFSNIENIIITGEYISEVDVSGLTNLTNLQLFVVTYGSPQGIGGSPVAVNLQGCDNLISLNMMNSFLDIDFCQVPSLEILNSFALDVEASNSDLDLNCLTNLRILDVSETQFNSLYLKNGSVLESFYGFYTYGNTLCIDDNQAEIDSLGDMVNNFQTVTTTCEESIGTNTIFGNISRNASVTGNNDCSSGTNDFLNPLRFNVMQNNTTVLNFFTTSPSYYETPIGLDQGDYVIVPAVNFSDGYVVDPEEFNVSFASNNNVMVEQDLCIKHRVETVDGIEIEFFPFYYPTDPNLKRFDAYIVLTNTNNTSYTGQLRLNYDDNYTSLLDYDDNYWPNSDTNGDAIWDSLTIEANDDISIWLRIRYNEDDDPDFPVEDGDQLVYDLFLTELTNPTTEYTQGTSTQPNFRLTQTINPGEEVLHIDDVMNAAENSQIKIYPNPSYGIINIETNESIKDVSIFSITGQLVNSIAYEQNNSEVFKIDISVLDKGIYFLSIKTDTSTFTQKVIKN